MNIQLGYNKEKVTVTIPDDNLQCVIKRNNIPLGETGIDEVRRALRNPIGTERLKDIVGKGEKICIVTSDITRPMPTKMVLPIVLEELQAAEIDDDDVYVVFALGNHRAHTEKEKKYLMGDKAYARIKCYDSDQSKVVNLGTTSLGTPVEVFDKVAEADRVICLGNIEYHYFAGYSGGAKAIMPGVSTAAAIQSNHKRMVEDTSIAGRIDGNNVRGDIEEAIDYQNIDFLVNVVLDENKEIVKAVAGHYNEAHREGCLFLDKLYKIKIEEKADIVLVSPGGYPKDLNLYQAQKALDNSKHAVKEGGIIILLAACNEGLGEEVFERWMREASSPSSMIEKIRKKFELGGHKAAAIGMVMEKSDVYLVSDMDKEFVESMFFKHYDSAQKALDAAMGIAGGDAKVIVMPNGGSTLPTM